MTRPSTGKGSRRYERYEASGEDVTTQPEKAETPEPKNRTEAEAERQRAKDYDNLNQGLPLHRGANQEVHDAVTRGLHGRTRSDAEIEAEKKRRWYGRTNTGTPLDHVGAKKEVRERIKKSAADELEQE